MAVLGLVPVVMSAGLARIIWRVPPFMFDGSVRFVELLNVRGVQFVFAPWLNP